MSEADSAEVKKGGLTLLRGPFKEGQCHECAEFHKPEQPHNQESLFWQFGFCEKHGRWPTWADALAHCSEEVRKAWISALAKHGIKVELPDLPSTTPVAP